jgi:hypothetical protein
MTDLRSPSRCGQMRLHTVALTRIEADRGAFRTHLGAYQFMKTRLAETIRVDPGGFARIWMLSQVLFDKQCDQIRAEIYRKIHIRVNCCGIPPDALGSCHIKMLFRSSSSLLNRILYFVQWCPSNSRYIQWRMAWHILGIPPCKRSLPRWRSSNTHSNLNAVHDKLAPGIGTSPYVYLSGMSIAKHFSNIDFFVSLVFARANTIYIFTFLPFCHKLLLPYLQEEGRRQKLILPIFLV